jgi:hypothetical protein
MWNGGDSVARSATWACFIQTNLQVMPSFNAWDADEVLFLRDGVSTFEIHRFINGTERLSSVADADYFRGGVAHWKPGDGPASLDVTKSNESLRMDLRYTDTESRSEHFHLEMRLSSGRFTSEWTAETKSLFSKSTSTEDYAGQCVLLPKPTK